MVTKWMLPHVANRPISLVRCPNGEGKPCFFQRHSGQENSKYVRHVKIPCAKEPFLAIDDVEGLISLAQMGTLEIHVGVPKPIRRTCLIVSCSILIRTRICHSPR
jgi:bifunctional non-homologous end joining protein LigD